jgi:hypothetical protein
LIFIEKGQFKKSREERLQREILYPLEPSYKTLLENPFHKSPRYTRQVVEFAWLWRGITTKNTLILLGSQEINCISNGLRLQAQIDNLRLKCCISGENPQNKSTGSSSHSSYRANANTLPKEYPDVDIV